MRRFMIIGIVLSLAMALALPFVTAQETDASTVTFTVPGGTDVTGTFDVTVTYPENPTVAPGETYDLVITVSAGDVEGFHAAVRKLIGNPSLRVELGRKARVRVLERYDTDAWGDAILGIYRSLIGHPRRRR